MYNVRGTTLLESLVAISVLVVASGMVYAFIAQNTRVQSFSFDQSTAISEARRGIETMVREIREIQTADNGAYAISSADDQQFIFFADMDKDDSVERVRYFLQGSEFKRGTIEPRVNPVEYNTSDEVVVTLSRYIRNNTLPVFTYYNGAWPGDTVNNPLPTPSDVTDVRFVKVFLRVNVKPNVLPTDFDLESNVAIRNLKDNL